MSTTDPGPAIQPPRPSPTVDELFAATVPVRSTDDLALDGVFEDGEVEELLADLYTMRRADTA